jgi:ribonuclease J
VTHSLPESAALSIETPAGRVVASGDFKIDEHPIDGHTTDQARLRAIGDLGVELLLSESTNAERPGRTRSEIEVGLEIERLVREAQGRVVVACFASHLHRLEGVVRAARSSGRRIALVGRALETAWRVGIEGGHLSADPTMLVDDRRIGTLPRRDVLVVVTGSQGEPRAGLARIAGGAEEQLKVVPGDRVIVSASTIPGNERAVRRLVNSIVRSGGEVLHDRMAMVHCSGHAHRDEQVDLLRWIRPRSFVPVHGDRAMLERHARTAIEAGVPAERVFVLEDGESVVLREGVLSRGPSEPITHRAIDADTGDVLPWSGVEDRRRLASSGVVVVSLAMDAQGRISGSPELSAFGVRLPEEVLTALKAELERAVGEVSGQPDAERKDQLRSRIRREISARTGARPWVEIQILEVRP